MKDINRQLTEDKVIKQIELFSKRLSWEEEIFLTLRKRNHTVLYFFCPTYFA